MAKELPKILGDDIKVESVLELVNTLEVHQKWYQDRADEIGQKLAAVRDRLNGRARKARSGKFTRRRKATPPEVEPTPLDHARRVVDGTELL